MTATRRGAVGRIEIAVFAIFALGAAAYFLVTKDEAKRPNVILISIDTLRADHLSCYGYRSKVGERTSPNLDALAARGARFEQAHSTTSWTLPSHVALLTGMPDELHAVRHDRIPLDENRTMLAERLTKSGYQCAGFFGGPYLDPHFGFGRGFSRYENCGAPTAYQTAEMRQSQQLVAAMEQQSHRIRTAAKITDGALDFLATRDGERPFFLFLHHWDVHYDYNAPEEFQQRFAGWYRGDLPMLDIARNPRVRPDMPAEDRDFLIASYDAEIAWVDAQIGRLLARVAELGLADDTYVVVVSDHGEEFFEHGSFGHRKNLHAESLRIPLLVAGPGVERGATVAETARIFDVYPTVLDLLDLPADDARLYGVSLAPLFEAEREAEVPPRLRDLPIVAELTLLPYVAGEDGAPLPPDHYFHHRAISSGEYKWIDVARRAFDPKRELDLDGVVEERLGSALYRFRDDPLEQRDLAAQWQAELERLGKRAEALGQDLVAYRAHLPTKANPTPKPMPEELSEQARQAGYLGASSHDDDDEQ
jgi:arylsulfatase A-like enzyme